MSSCFPTPPTKVISTPTTLSYSAILSVKASVCDPSLPLFDHLVRPGQILSTDGGVLIVDQIYLVIPDPRRFPHALGPTYDRASCIQAEHCPSADQFDIDVIGQFLVAWPAPITRNLRRHHSLTPTS